MRRSLIRLIALPALVASGLSAGCKPAPVPAKAPSEASKFSYPPRPGVLPSTFKVFHQDEDTYTLVTDANATDAQIEAILWELRDAAHAQAFDKLHLSQKFVDTRKPSIWFHVYRGAKCANEKFVQGKYPCGASYHGAGDYTLGSYTNKLWDDGQLRGADGTQTPLWDSEAPYAAASGRP